jgi:hypothetical protein
MSVGIISRIKGCCMSTSSFDSLDNYVIPYVELIGLMNIYDSDDAEESEEASSSSTSLDVQIQHDNSTAYDDVHELPKIYPPFRISSEDESWSADLENKEVKILDLQKADDALLRKIATIHGELVVLMEFSDDELKRYSPAQIQELGLMIRSMGIKMIQVSDNAALDLYESFYRETKERITRLSPIARQTQKTKIRV